MIVPPLAGVLSAYGIGLADATAMREQSVEAELDEAALGRVRTLCHDLAARTRAELRADAVPDAAITTHARVLLRYAGTDAGLSVPLDTVAGMTEAFETTHRARYAFTMDKPLVVEAVSVEAVGTAGEHGEYVAEGTAGEGTTSEGTAGEGKFAPRATVRMFVNGARRDTPSTGAETCGPVTPSKVPRSSPRPTPPPSSTPAGGRQRATAGTCC